MSRILRITISLLLVAMLLSGIAQAQDVTKTKMDIGTCFIQLEDYLQKGGGNGSHLEIIRENFDRIGGTNGKALALYCDVLIALNNQDFALAEIYVDLLRNQKDRLDKYLSEIDSQYVEVFSVLESFVKGRVAENKGDYTSAVIHYSQAITFLDAMDRWNTLQEQENASKYENGFALYRAGKYTEALAAFESMSNQNYQATAALIDDCKKKIAETTPTPTPKPTKTPTPTPMSTYNSSMVKGQMIMLGSYEQDNNERNGKETLEWIVVDIKDGKALITTKYGIDKIPYHYTSIVDGEWKGVTWEHSSIRQWLNDDFLYSSFTTQERDCILTTHVDNSTAQGNPEWNTSGGNNTYDWVFLFSYTEINKYFPTSESRILQDTAYAQSKSGSRGWFLRSPGIVERLVNGRDSNGKQITIFVCDIDGYGGTFPSWTYIDDLNNSVRPCMWIDIQQYEMN